MIGGAIKKLTMDENGEILTPSEMGKRGATARWSREKPLTIDDPPDTHALRAAEKLTREIHRAMQSRFGPVVPIPVFLIREWAELFVRAKASGKHALAREVLKDLTKILMPLVLRHSSAPASPRDLQLPSDADLSHLSDEELERVTGRKMTHLELTTATVKRQDEPDIHE